MCGTGQRKENHRKHYYTVRRALRIDCCRGNRTRPGEIDRLRSRGRRRRRGLGLICHGQWAIAVCGASRRSICIGKGRLYIYIYTHVSGVRLLINNCDVTRRFLSLRAGPICIAAAAYELMNHRHRRTVFFLDWWKSHRIFFPLLPFLQRRSAFSTVVLPRENTHLSRSCTHTRSRAHTHAHPSPHAFVHSSYFIPLAYQNR